MVEIAAEPENKKFDCIIYGASILDGTGREGFTADVGVVGDKIAAIGNLSKADCLEPYYAKNKCLAPGFIDVHTHDDMSVFKSPEMLSKVSQGVTTIVVGNCGISASPVLLGDRDPPDPMNLLGSKSDFRFSTFAAYAREVEKAGPAVNTVSLIGHTSLRNNFLDRLDRPASKSETEAMSEQLENALAEGAFGLSTGLAYASANSAATVEVVPLMRVLGKYSGIYATHLRSEFSEIIEAMDEAFFLADEGKVPLVISHFKCAGIENWGRSAETVGHLEEAGKRLDVSCDCYPYSASSSTLDLAQVTGDFDIYITWSRSHPEEAGQLLSDIAQKWSLSLTETAEKLRPGGAVYHNMCVEDMERILKYRNCMIGSDGLPNDHHPHPRLWGTFPRVLGFYCRDKKILNLNDAVRKITSLPANKYRVKNRGKVEIGYFADLVVFDQKNIRDKASYENPIQKSDGIDAVWVNGKKTYDSSKKVINRAGRLLYRNKI